MIEIFKDIEGYSGLYQISNLGRVKSLNYRRTGKEKILKQAKTKLGYLYVFLKHKQEKAKPYYIHRLVGQVFIDNPNNFREINHIDEDKTNNAASNLEWCDRKHNINYGTRNEKISKQVLCIETGKIYASTKEVQRQLGFGQGNISLACNGKGKTAYGFHWKYLS